uniref:Secreted protein n=1 Tax=Oryza brachyantha TaxID=4533 RepID=J3LFL7_ORYBR
MSSLVLLLLMSPLEDRRAEHSVGCEFAVFEPQVRHRRPGIPAVEPLSDGIGFVRVPVCCDVRISHHLLLIRQEVVVAHILQEDFHWVPCKCTQPMDLSFCWFLGEN